MYKTISLAFNIKHAILFVAVAGLLLSALLLPAHTAQAQTTTNGTSTEQFVSPELVAQLETLRALVEELVALVEQVRAQGGQDVGTSVSMGASSLGENIVRVFVGSDLKTIRFRNDREEARAVCMDAITLSPADDRFASGSTAQCTWNGETIYSGTTMNLRSGSSAFEGIRSTHSSGDRLDSGSLVGPAESTDGTSANLPDLIVGDADFEQLITSIRFHYAIENRGTATVDEERVNVLLEVDLGCDGGSEYVREFSASMEPGETEPGEGWYSFDKNDFINQYLVQNPNGCFGFTVDYAEDLSSEEGPIESDGNVLESNEDNNFSGWIDFGTGGSSDGGGEPVADPQCPDGYYWDAADANCIDTSV